MSVFQTEVKSFHYRRWEKCLESLFDSIKSEDGITAAFICGQMAQLFGDRADVLEEKEHEETLNL